MLQNNNYEKKITMKENQRFILFAILFIYGLSNIQAQTATTTTGGEATGSGGSASYSIGQVAYTTITGTGGTVSQGVQQPYEILVETGIEQKGVDLQCVVYPNPVTDYLMLNIDNDMLQTIQTTSKLSYQLFDTKGQLITTGEVSTAQTKIITGNLTKGTYLLRVISDNKAIKTFKIIKK